ncbi:MAG: hypothetical protein PVH11_07250 [Anaerolineae bacterium]|jgi:hypothetical protein
MPTLQQIKDQLDVSRLTAFIGKKAIVGLYQFYEGEPYRRSQDFGEIAGFEDGLMMLQTLVEKGRFPIQYKALVPAPRGTYVLEATKEKVVNPDFLVSWRLDLTDNLEDSQWEANTAPHFDSIVGKEWDFEYSYDQEYLKELMDSRGEDLVGKTILAGVREYELLDDGTRTLVKQSQMYGESIRVSLAEGIVIKLKDGSEHKLPPDISMVQYAPPGEYTLHSTGEVIVNPDLMTSWSLTAPTGGG